MKRLLCALICVLPVLAGCGVNGTSNSGPATTTTLYGSLQPPAVDASAMIGQSRRDPAVRSQAGYNTELLADFAENGTCKVNGKAVSFTLNTGDSSFLVSGLEPSGAYEVRFELASLSLRATKPYIGIQMNMGTVNLTSTAKSFLYEAYQATFREIQNYDILESVASPLATKLGAWLDDDGMTPAVFGEYLTNELNAIRGLHTLKEISKFIGNDMSGTWSGQGALYMKTLAGDVGQKASVNLTLNTVRNTNTLTGWVNVEVVSTTKMSNGAIIPVSGKRAFSATVATEGQFSFEVTNSEQTPVERWSFSLDSTDALVCTVESLHAQGFQSYSDNLPKLRQ